MLFLRKVQKKPSKINFTAKKNVFKRKIPSKKNNAPPDSSKKYKKSYLMGFNLSTFFFCGGTHLLHKIKNTLIKIYNTQQKITKSNAKVCLRYFKIQRKTYSESKMTLTFSPLIALKQRVPSPPTNLLFNFILHNVILFRFVILILVIIIKWD